MKKFFLLVAFMPFLLLGCSTQEDAPSTTDPNTSKPSEEISDSDDDSEAIQEPEISSLASGQTSKTTDDPETTDPTSISDNPSTMPTIDQTALPEKGDEIAVIQTNMGTIKVRFFPEQAPKTVENFIGLAKQGYYDGIIFHRVIPNFMIQGGDPTGTGAGGESLWGGKFENEISMDLSNLKYSLAMANAGKDTNGSQFFINQVDNTYLNGYEGGKMKDCSIYGVSCHTVFGQVFEGMDIVDKIAAVKTGAGDKPVEEVKMEKVTVETY